MATQTIQRPVPTFVHTERAHNVSVAAVGVTLSYVVPAGRVAKVLAVSRVLTAGAQPTIALQAILGGVTVTLISVSTNQQLTYPIWLQAGDTIQWNVTTLGAAGTDDQTLTIEDYEAV